MIHLYHIESISTEIVNCYTVSENFEIVYIIVQQCLHVMSWSCQITSLVSLRKRQVHFVCSCKKQGVIRLTLTIDID